MIYNSDKNIISKGKKNTIKNNAPKGITWFFRVFSEFFQLYL
jgi:hypothetical protein